MKKIMFALPFPFVLLPSPFLSFSLSSPHLSILNPAMGSAWRSALRSGRKRILTHFWLSKRSSWQYFSRRCAMQINGCVLLVCQVTKIFSRFQGFKPDNTFKEINNRKQRVYCLSYCLKQLPHPAVFASNVQCVRLAAGRRTQAADQ